MKNAVASFAEFDTFSMLLIKCDQIPGKHYYFSSEKKVMPEYNLTFQKIHLDSFIHLFY